MRLPHVAALTLALACLRLCGASAQAAAADESAVGLRYSLKGSALVTRAPDNPVLFPARDTATGLWRFRIEPAARVSESLTFDAAFEQRLRVFSAPSSLVGASVLPSTAPAPYRIRQLDWAFASSSHSEWRGEIDRAAGHVHTARAELTVGRQAIGWGRGVLFGAVDLFAPFNPLEADREWRRGVDAVRGDIKIRDRVSLDAVGAFAERLDHSAGAARLRGYAGRTDVELLGGVRARDGFLGVTSSTAVARVELHGELAVFHTPAVPGSIVFPDTRTIAKAVAGGSSRLPFGANVLLSAEYHYSGFGATSAASLLAQLADPAFQERYLRGDFQILGRHATAVVVSAEYSPALAVSVEWLQNPVDGSGVIIPSSVWTLGDRWSVVASGYVPYGREPVGRILSSEFGASPLGAFVQFRVYR